MNILPFVSYNILLFVWMNTNHFWMNTNNSNRLKTEQINKYKNSKECKSKSLPG